VNNVGAVLSCIPQLLIRLGDPPALPPSSLGDLEAASKFLRLEDEEITRHLRWPGCQPPSQAPLSGSQTKNHRLCRWILTEKIRLTGCSNENTRDRWKLEDA
jgi:hypothetical protein